MSRHTRRGGGEQESIFLTQKGDQIKRSGWWGRGGGEGSTFRIYNNGVFNTDLSKTVTYYKTGPLNKKGKGGGEGWDWNQAALTSTIMWKACYLKRRRGEEEEANRDIIGVFCTVVFGRQWDLDWMWGCVLGQRNFYCVNHWHDKHVNDVVWGFHTASPHG